MRTDPLVAIWDLGGSIVHIPLPRRTLVVRRCSSESILQSRRKRCELRVGYIVICVSKVRPNQSINPVDRK